MICHHLPYWHVPLTPTRAGPCSAALAVPCCIRCLKAPNAGRYTCYRIAAISLSSRARCNRDRDGSSADRRTDIRLATVNASTVEAAERRVSGAHCSPEHSGVLTLKKRGVSGFGRGAKPTRGRRQHGRAHPSRWLARDFRAAAATPRHSERELDDEALLCLVRKATSRCR